MLSHYIIQKKIKQVGVFAIFFAFAFLCACQASGSSIYNQGVEAYENKDYTKAAELYQKAADQGHVRAEFNLGFLYQTGQGLPLDRVLSYAWATLAIKNGGSIPTLPLPSKFREVIKKDMTAGAIRDAEILASQWQPGKSLNH